MDKQQYDKLEESLKRTKICCHEHFLALLSGLRKVGNLTDTDKAYNDALGDAFDYIIENRKNYLFENTVRQGKWVRD